MTDPVDEAALNVAEYGAEPFKVVVVIAACNDVVFDDAKVNEKGVECGLSLPLLKRAVKVKEVVLLERDTVQSIEVAVAWLV